MSWILLQRSVMSFVRPQQMEEQQPASLMGGTTYEIAYRLSIL